MIFFFLQFKVFLRTPGLNMAPPLFLTTAQHQNLVEVISFSSNYCFSKSFRQRPISWSCCTAATSLEHSNPLNIPSLISKGNSSPSFLLTPVILRMRFHCPPTPWATPLICLVDLFPVMRCLSKASSYLQNKFWEVKMTLIGSDDARHH